MPGPGEKRLRPSLRVNPFISSRHGFGSIRVLDQSIDPRGRIAIHARRIGIPFSPMSAR